MSLTQDQATYGMRDLKLFPLLTDNVGGTPTYAAGIDAAFIQDFSWQPIVKKVELKGDDKKETKTYLESIEGSFKVGKRHLNVMKAILGGTYTAPSGSAPNQLSTFTRKQGDNIPYFKIEGQSMDFSVSGGDEHVILYKCIITQNENTYSQENPREISFSFSGEFLHGMDETIFDVVQNETAVAIDTAATP